MPLKQARARTGHRLLSHEIKCMETISYLSLAAFWQARKVVHIRIESRHSIVQRNKQECAIAGH